MQSNMSNKKDMIAASAAWKLKAHTMTEKGAAAAHAYIKKPKGMDQHILSNGLPQIGQKAIQTLEAQWRPLWQAPGRRGAPHTVIPPSNRSHDTPPGTAVDYQNYYIDLHDTQSPLPQLPSSHCNALWKYWAHTKHSQD